MSGRHLMRMFLTAVFVLAGISGAFAQKYEPWRDPDATRDEVVNSLLDELEPIVKAAKRDRAASPGVIRDLEALLERYGASRAAATEREPTREERRAARVVFTDDFLPGNRTGAPDWQVIRKGWVIDNTYGLRSTMNGSPQNGRRQTTGNVAADILGEVFRQSGNAQQGEVGVAELKLSTDVPNAFAMRTTVVDHGGTGSLSIGVLQSGRTDVGYSLAFSDSGRGAFLQLFRISSRGTRKIAQNQAPAGRRDANGTVAWDIAWVRDETGDMKVNVEGVELLRVADRSFRDDWNAVSIVNDQGDFSVRKIAVRRVGR